MKLMQHNKGDDASHETCLMWDLAHDVDEVEMA